MSINTLLTWAGRDVYIVLKSFLSPTPPSPENHYFPLLVPFFKCFYRFTCIIAQTSKLLFGNLTPKLSNLVHAWKVFKKAEHSIFYLKLNICAKRWNFSDVLWRNCGGGGESWNGKVGKKKDFQGSVLCVSFNFFPHLSKQSFPLL